MMAFRLSKEKVAEVDAWANEQLDKPSRSEALRRLIDAGLQSRKTRSRT
jgi:metal-responsive CopG/Arc/MetJ family transcriptional regulator